MTDPLKMTKTDRKKARDAAMAELVRVNAERARKRLPPYPDTVLVETMDEDETSMTIVGPGFTTVHTATPERESISKIKAERKIKAEWLRGD